jgi:hypothetical protein
MAWPGRPTATGTAPTMTDQPALRTSVVHPRRSRLDRWYDAPRRGCVAGRGSAKLPAASKRSSVTAVEALGRRLSHCVAGSLPGDKHAWAGPDRLRPLSEAGRREAHGLLTQLRDYRITRILSSPATRCLQTVEPLAQRRGLPVEPAQVLGVDADPGELVTLAVGPGGRCCGVVQPWGADRGGPRARGRARP